MMSKVDNTKVNSYWIKKKQKDELADIKIINTDFYKNLPQTICETLDKIRWRWISYDWFEEAWNKYRNHVLKISLNKKHEDLKMPGFVFNSYINNQVKEDFLEEEERGLVHSDKNVCELYHYGIKDQKWGVRRYQNEDGTLTVLGKQRYYKDNSYQKDNVIEVSSKPVSQNEPNNTKSLSSLQKTEITKESLMAAKKTTEDLQKMIPTKGTHAIRKSYPDISNDELQRRLNRLNLEKQYSDAIGDTKYVKNGEERTREIFQSVGAALGMAATAATLIYTIQNIFKKTK